MLPENGFAAAQIAICHHDFRLDLNIDGTGLPAVSPPFIIRVSPAAVAPPTFKKLMDLLRAFDDDSHDVLQISLCHLDDIMKVLDIEYEDIRPSTIQGETVSSSAHAFAVECGVRIAQIRCYEERIAGLWILPP